MKQKMASLVDQGFRSPPARGRGLKPSIKTALLFDPYVAPRAGAWIETEDTYPMSGRSWVAPRAGAWIETMIPAKSSALRLSRPPRGGVD